MEYIQFSNGIEIPMIGFGTLHIAPCDAEL